MAEQQSVVTPVQPLKIPSGLKELIEGLIFAADEPLSVRQIKAIYEQQAPEGEERHLEQAEIQHIIQELNAEYQKRDKAYRIIAIAGGYQFATMKEYAEWIGRLYKEQSRRKLSQSSLESLAIIAYKQPISKPEIEAIRGVNCDYVLKTLLEKELTTIVGRAETVGRPLLYGTTREFLQHFGLNEVTDLPRPREIEEILGESQFETERRMLEAQAGAEQMKKEEEDFKSRLPHIPKKKPEMNDAVHVVPKTRTRRINLREGREQDQGSAEQAKMQFEQPAGGKTTPPAAETRESKSETPPLREEPPQREAPEAKLEEPDTEQQNESPVDEIVPESAVDSGLSEEPDIRHVPLANDGETADVERNEIPLTPPRKTEPEMSQPRRTRWTVWKEKVQTFIKKLFG